MTVGIATFSQQCGVRNVASTRIRVRWPLRYWPDAEEFRVGGRYDAVIFQKAYWLEYATQFSGPKILDLCDPDFLEDGPRSIAMMDLSDAVTCSSPALTAHVASLTRTPVSTIPDRVDLEAIGSLRKAHDGPTTTVAWYGNSQNFPMLDLSIDWLLQYGLTQLLVIASPKTPYRLPEYATGRITLTNLAWTDETAFGDLLKADVILNPRSETGIWRFKSNNKTVLAWALGLPVAHDAQELGALMTDESRRREAERRLPEVRATYDVRHTVRDYQRLIAEIAQRRREAASDARVHVDNGEGR